MADSPSTSIFTALGHSVSSEDYRGNFTMARQLAEAFLTDARAQGDAGQLAEALLWRGIVHLLQGEVGAAAACVEEVPQLVPEDANRCLRAVGYAIQATYIQFNTFPDGSGANSTELVDRWGGVAYVQEQDARYQTLYAQATVPLAQFEAWFAYGFLSSLRPARSVLEDSRHIPPGGSRTQLLETLLQSANRLRQLGETYHLPGLSTVAALAAADLCRRAGQLERAQQHCDSALQAYQGIGDAVGEAVCYMIRGDWLAAPYSSPLVWNFAMRDSSSEGSNLSWVWEAAEGSRAGLDIVGAREAYQTAETLFAQANAPRGMAALALRRGYLAMLADDYATAAVQAQRAAQAFADCGDWCHHWLAQVHLLLSHVGAGRLAGHEEMIEHIGAWGVHRGSFSYALGLGPHSNGFSGRPRGLGCGEQLAPRFPVTTQPEEALHRLMRSQITSTISTI
jgi:tetratricopeptide (TPR) repeat protein